MFEINFEKKDKMILIHDNKEVITTNEWKVIEKEMKKIIDEKEKEKWNNEK